MTLMANTKPNCFDVELVRLDFLDVVIQSFFIFAWMKKALKEWLDVWPKVTASELPPELWE